MKSKKGNKFLSVAFKILLGVIALILVLPLTLYIPFVQDWAKDIAVKEIKKSTGIDVSIGLLRIGFPLDVDLEDVVALDAQGDTLATLRLAQTEVALLPLLKGRVDVDGLSLRDVYYRQGTRDSVVYLTAAVDRFDIDDVNFNLRNSNLDIDKALLDGARVNLIIKDTITESTPDTANISMRIAARELMLKNVDFTMQMLPIIDSLGVVVPRACLTDGVVDLSKRLVDARSLIIDSVSAAYLTPAVASVRSVQQGADTIPSRPWTITADQLRLTGNRALYATRGHQPQPGFDSEYISASDIIIEVDSFYNRAAEIRVPIRKISAFERSGLDLSLTGLFAMDSTAMKVTNASLTTPNSRLLASAMLGLGDFSSPAGVPLMLNAEGAIGLADITMALPSIKKFTRGLPRTSAVDLICNVDGRSSDINVSRLRAGINRHFNLAAQGRVRNITDFNRMDGEMKLDGRISNLNFVRGSLLNEQMSKILHLPAMTLKGNVKYRPGGIVGDIDVTTASGRLALAADWVRRADGYDLKLNADRFPLQNFLPTMGLSDLTMNATMSGQGFDPTKPGATSDIDLVVDRIGVGDKTIQNVRLAAKLVDNIVSGNATSANADADFDVAFRLGLYPSSYTWDIDGDLRHLDLAALGLSKERMGGSMIVESQGSMTPSPLTINGTLDVAHMQWAMSDFSLTIPEIAATLASTDSLTSATVKSTDLSLNAEILCGLDTLGVRASRLSPFIANQIKNKRLDVEDLQHLIPPMDLALSVGSGNPFEPLLADSDIGFNRLTLNAHNDSLIAVNAHAVDLMIGSTLLNDLNLDLNQRGKFLLYNLVLANRPGNMDEFADVTLNGFVANDRLSAFLKQANRQGEQGFRIGATLQLSDSTVRATFVPQQPTIGYKKWQINPDNFVAYDFADKHLDADLTMESQRSLLRLFTDHDTLSSRHQQEEVVLQLQNIELQDWLTISPFAPPIKGAVDADMRFQWDRRQLTGNGLINLTDLYYGRERVGSFTLDALVANDFNNHLRADLSLLVDSVKVITASGEINDSVIANPLSLDFSMIHFPLRILNPMLPKEYAQLKGMLNGQMNISGTLSAPRFDGYINFDSTAVKVGMMGTSYSFSKDKIAVDSSIVRFNNFAIKGLNKNPLKVNGEVDCRKLTDVVYDLTLKASDMQIVNSDRPKGADIYGKAFIDLDAAVKGNMRFANVDAMLNILPGTNVTYVVSDSRQVLASQSSTDMVKFVQFNDTTQVHRADTIQPTALSMIIDAALIVSEGSTINVNLSPDGKNKLSLNSEGNLAFSMNPMNSGRLTGRLNVNGGFVRYTPPLMSEKNFKFKEGSYVAFTGDILNPVLNIHAVDKLRANVTQDGQNSRIVNFDVDLSVTNTLNNMDVAFDLTTDDDIAIQNELEAMSPEQRANQAMNMLLYNIYSGPQTRANANISGNPLYSFLSSQINSWAANNIRGVDLSFGVDQYDKTTDGNKQSTMSYSYRVSKTLFDDRFKIVVGGNYSTDADVDENFSQNLINDISFEYMLNRSGNMYVRLFRHNDYESVLEGEITQTGVGFVLKRKLNSLRDIFKFKRAKTQLPIQSSPSTPKK